MRIRFRSLLRCWNDNSVHSWHWRYFSYTNNDYSSNCFLVGSRSALNEAYRSVHWDSSI